MTDQYEDALRAQGWQDAEIASGIARIEAKLDAQLAAKDAEIARLAAERDEWETNARVHQNEVQIAEAELAAAREALRAIETRSITESYNMGRDISRLVAEGLGQLPKRAQIQGGR